ncbi:FAD-dependent monooxygenase [Amycolatopsis sp. NPDC005961]|uniref:FAD-dependent oxidoreductase n=1 Tax=Amycolatopsis sp. NPDC005961 TaxID=3156720 RepID=UPI0033EEB35C
MNPPTAVVVGASVAGLATSLALSRIGYRVIAVDRSAPPPEGPLSEVAGTWHRPTVAQAQQSHTMTSLGVRVLRERAPELLDELLASGAVLLDLTRAMPEGATDRARRPEDADLVALGCRRTTFELVLHRAVRARRDVCIRYRTTVRGLEVDEERRVRHVVTACGDLIPADVVVDATGRGAGAGAWLRAAGVTSAEDELSPSGLAGFTRFYRLAGDTLPGELTRGHAAGGVWDHYAGVLHPGDGGTFAIAIGTPPGDAELARVRDASAFTAVAEATPGLSGWLETGISEPISAVRPFTSPSNALRGTIGGAVTGLFPVGDAACVTNPLFGRGMSLALAHAFALADLLADRPVVDAAQAEAAARLADDFYRPWYEHTVSADRERIARWRTARDATAPGGAADAAAIATAAASDGLVWRGLTRMLMSLTTPAELAGDETFTRRVARAPAVTAAGERPPTRAELVRTIMAAKGT